MTKDWTGNKRSTFATLGASNHVAEERQAEDYYATDPNTIDDLLKLEKFSQTIWEPACGEGHLSKRLEELGKEVSSTDLIDRGYGIGGINFLEMERTDDFEFDIITNPPYKYAQEFVEHSMDLIRDGGKVAMFLKVLFLEGISRYEMFKKYPPKKVYVYSKRQMCAKNGDFKALGATSSATAYAWFVWEKGFEGNPTIEWINPEGVK